MLAVIGNISIGQPGGQVAFKACVLGILEIGPKAGDRDGEFSTLGVHTVALQEIQSQSPLPLPSLSRLTHDAISLELSFVDLIS